jgi:transcriptional regulator with XRE-family HTH domain
MEPKVSRHIDSVDLQVGSRVRAYRLSRGITQADLGKKIGVTFQQVQKYEKGINRIGSGRLKKIADTLGVPIVALFGDDEKGADRSFDRLLTEMLSQPLSARLLRAFIAIKGNKQRLALIELAEGMARYRN